MVVDSVTHLDISARGRTVVCGSHGGAYSGAYAARLGVRAIILNDAGVGRDGAGIAGLDLLDRHGIPAAAVTVASALIGDGLDVLEHGVVGHVNLAAAVLGCAAGQTARAAVVKLEQAPAAAVPKLEPKEERHLIEPGPPAVWALDSAAPSLRPMWARSL